MHFDGVSSVNQDFENRANSEKSREKSKIVFYLVATALHFYIA